MENKGLSRSGIIAKLFGNPVQWSSKLQSVPALSTCEAEWYAVDSIHRELLWIRAIITEIGQPLNTSPIYCDNLPAIRILNNDSPTNRTKHVDRTFYHIKHHLRNESSSRFSRLEF